MDIDKLKLLGYVAEVIDGETEEDMNLLDFMSPDPEVQYFVRRTLWFIKLLRKYAEEE